MSAAVEHVTTYLFADDTKCLHAVDSPSNQALARGFKQIWTKSSKVSFNCTKHAILHFWNNSNNHATFSIDPISVTKDLGVMIRNDLQWSDHYNMITSKAYKSLGLICCSFTTNFISVKKMLYISLICSQLATLLFPNLEALLDQTQDIVLLEKVQKRSTKYILNDFTSSYVYTVQDC